MRKIVYGGATSLDMYLARENHEVDWLMWSDEAAKVTMSLWNSIDTVLLGRKTFEVAMRSGGGGSMPGVCSYVFSRTLTDVPEGAVLIRDRAEEFVADLKAREGKGIFLMGGGELAQSLFEANLIDEVGFNIHPVLLGSGIPAIHRMSRPIDLDLIECQRFSNGCIYAQYRVKHS